MIPSDSPLTPDLDVLNRFPDSERAEHTVHIMKYIFPRQFGLHNAFTSIVDPLETAQPFIDYTMREREIATKDFAYRIGRHHRANEPLATLPKRLRAKASHLIQKVQRKHKHCCYTELLRHYCPLTVREAIHYQNASW